MVLSWSVVAAEWAGGLHLLPFQRAIVQDKSTSSRHIPDKNGRSDTCPRALTVLRSLGDTCIVGHLDL